MGGTGPRPKSVAPRQAAAWAPASGIFGATTGLDHRLFEGGSLRPGVRGAVMERLDRCLRVDSGLAGSDWQQWLRVWIAGGSASEWAGSRPNDEAQDLDVIVGLDLAEAQGNSSFEGMDSEQAATALNAAFRHCFNETGWRPEFGGTWSLTAYCNPHVGDDITVIRPYAAWDLTGSRWSVRPPHLPEHSLADFDPAVIAHGRAVLAEARAILRMPEPLRTREARSLWEHVHEHRCQAFSSEGTGVFDPGNVDEKFMQYAHGGVLAKIRDLAMAKTASAPWGGDFWNYREPEPQAVPLEDLHDVASMNHPGYTIGEVWRHFHPEDEGGRHHGDEEKAEEARDQAGLRDYAERNGTIPGHLTVCKHGTALEDGEHRYMAARDAGLESVPVLNCGVCTMPGLHRNPKTAAAGPLRVACLGNSIAAADGEESYLGHACRLAGGRIFHAGAFATGGLSSTQAVARHLEEVIAARPDACVLGPLAANNHALGVGLGQTTADIEGAAGALLRHGITPVLVLEPPHSDPAASALIGRCNDWVSRYAAGHGLPAVDFSGPLSSADGVHPDAVGARDMGRRLADALSLRAAAAREDAWDDEGENTDRYVTCDQGHDHWGAAGAAGLLIRHRGDDGQHRYLLQHRSPYVQHGGTWSTPGGALTRGEEPEEGARREAEEEFGQLPRGLRHHHTFTDDHGGWAYHTVVMDSPHRFEPEGEGEGDWETQGHGWFTPEEMKGLQLHPGFAASWQQVRKSGAAQKEAGYVPGTPLYHGSLSQFAPGTILTPEGRDPDGSSWSGDHVYASESPEAARYFGSMHDTTPQSNADVHVHRVEPVGDVEPDEFPEGAEDERFARGNYRAKALRVLDSRRVPGHWAEAAKSGAATSNGNAFPLERGADLPTRVGAAQPWMQWAGSDQPDKAVIWHAQQRTREDHPELTERLPEPEGEGFSREGEAILHRALAAGGYPPGHAERTFVMMHQRPDDRGTSQVAMIGNRTGVAIHPDSWHAGTVAHEGAHLLDIWHRNVNPLKPQTDREKHGPQFAAHYATALNAISPGAGDDFLRHHTDAVQLVGNYRARVHGLPRDFSDEIRREAAAAGERDFYHGTCEPGLVPGEDMIEPGHPSNWPGMSDPEKVYFTRSRKDAIGWARKSRGDRLDPPPVVYKVRPTGPYEPDSEGYSSSHPLEIVQEMTRGGWERRKEAATGYEGLTKRSGMIYLDIPDGKVRHLPGGVDDHHITLVYLGKDVGDDAFAEAVRRTKAAAEAHPPMEGSIGGLGSFPPSDSSDGKKPVFVPVDVPGIHKLRKSLEDLNGSQFKDYKPHVTLAYLEDGEAMPAPHPTTLVSFSRLHVKRGDEITSFPFGGRISKAAAWDASGSEHSGVYLRFGEWPHDERSYSPAGGYKEEGVSVYDLDRNGDPSIDHGLDRGHVHDDDCDVDEFGTCIHSPDPGEEPDNDPREEMQGRVHHAERNRYYGSDHPSTTGHLVRGEMSGIGYDGEPLLKNVRRVGDWIDHRHLFLDQAHPHRLARDPAAEDYEEPEEKAPYSYRNHG
jgi:8-oxo-dGTP diphosphatase